MEHPLPSRFLRLLSSLLLILQGILLAVWIFYNQLALPEFLLWSGRTHPLLVHFPIALVCLLTLAWLFRRWIGTALFRDETFKNLLLLSAVVSTLTALSGYFLAGNTDYDETVLNRHRHLGSLTALLSSLMWVICPGKVEKDATAPKRTLFFTALNGLTLIVLVLAGHHGGSLTHGEGYLLPDSGAPAPVSRVITDSSTLFEAAVLPVFEQKCLSCHNDQKSKGGFVMTNVAALQKGGKTGAPWIPGDPVRSLMVERMLLDLDDKKHMPPRGKPQLSAAEIGLISYWIQRGADLHQRLRALPAEDSLRRMAESLLPAASPTAEKQYDFPPADPSQLARLQSPFRHIVPLYQGSPALGLSFFLRQQFSVKMLEECTVLAPQIVSLTLAHMPVGDDVLPILEKFTQLENLNLAYTGITGNALQSLTRLQRIETLSLSGTTITAAQLRALQGLPRLRKVFIAQTGIDSIALASLQSAIPRVQWVLGNTGDGGERLRLTPPQPVDPDKRIFDRAETFSLKHPMKGVSIRYTLDGSPPDSLQAAAYQSPIAVSAPMTVRAIAVMEGWYASEEVRYQVFPKGKMPIRSTLSSFPDTRYALQGATSLFDGQTGEPGNLLVNWMGFREQPMQLQVALQGDQQVHQVTLSTGIHHGAYVFPPQEIRVRAAIDSGRWTYTASTRPEQPGNFGPMENKPFIISLKPGRWKYLEITVRPVPALPSWHPGKGQKGWAFIDEVFID
jgi:uncharacterized membrane protein